MDSSSVLQSRIELKSGGKTKRYLGSIKYKDTDIAQYHNPNLFIRDILGENETKQFTSILIIGSPGTGKTTLATFIGHQLHTLGDYLVIHFKRKDLLKFDVVMASLPNRNLVLIFDDVSLVFKNIQDPEKRAKILTTLTEARHPNFEDTDRRIVVIANIHYTNAIEKMWRSQGGWKIYTDLSGEEIDNFNHMTKGRYKHQVDIFSRITTDMFRRKKFTVSLTNRQTKEYTIDKPFRFVMCYDNSTVRFFLTPQEFCSYCAEGENQHVKIKAHPNDVIKLAKKYYKDDGIAGLKLALLVAGHTEQYRNKTVYAFNTGQDILQSIEVDREELALELRKKAQIKDTRLYTIRKKKVDYLKDLEDIQKNEGNVTFATPQRLKEKDDTNEDVDLDL